MVGVLRHCYISICVKNKIGCKYKNTKDKSEIIAKMQTQIEKINKNKFRSTLSKEQKGKCENGKLLKLEVKVTFLFM